MLVSAVPPLTVDARRFGVADWDDASAQSREPA